MNAAKRLGQFAALTLVVLLAQAAWAQQKDPRIAPISPQPTLPGDKGAAGAPDSAANRPAAPQEEKAPPLTSLEGWRLGGSKTRNYFVPSFGFSQGGDTNPGNRATDEGFRSASSVNGDIEFHRLSGRSELTGMYSGGASFYNGNEDVNSWYQKLDLTQKVNGRRWTLLFGDKVDYRQDPFGGYGGFRNVPGGVGGAPGDAGVVPALLPNQTIATGLVPRVSNTAFAELQRAAGRRSSFTLNGSYGLVRYMEAGLNDTNSATFGAGYDYAVTARDTLAVNYGVNLFRYPGTPQTNDSHMVQMMYRRMLSGRLALDLGAGPQVTLIDGSVFGSRRVLSWSLTSSLKYKLERSTLTMTYAHSTTGGSGFFLGAETDNVGASWTLPLSRLWTATWDFGYAHNKPIGGITAGGSVYDTLSGGFRIGRPLGRYGSLFLNYSATHQASDAPPCAGVGCGFLGTRHVFGLGFNFRLKPVELE